LRREERTWFEEPSLPTSNKIQGGEKLRTFAKKEGREREKRKGYFIKRVFPLMGRGALK